MTDNFGRWTSSEASKQLQDFCFPKKAEKMTVLNKKQQEDIKKIFPRNDPDCREVLPSNWQELNKSVIPLSAEDDKKVLVVSLPLHFNAAQLRHVCMDCRVVYREATEQPSFDSHGLCPECEKKREQEIS
jgi:hypothetical protein